VFSLTYLFFINPRRAPKPESHGPGENAEQRRRSGRRRAWTMPCQAKPRREGRGPGLRLRLRLRTYGLAWRPCLGDWRQHAFIHLPAGRTDARIIIHCCPRTPRSRRRHPRRSLPGPERQTPRRTTSWAPRRRLAALLPGGSAVRRSGSRSRTGMGSCRSGTFGGSRARGPPVPLTTGGRWPAGPCGRRGWPARWR
jgi:hypothetical protein